MHCRVSRDEIQRDSLPCGEHLNFSSAPPLTESTHMRPFAVRKKHVCRSAYACMLTLHICYTHTKRPVGCPCRGVRKETIGKDAPLFHEDVIYVYSHCHIRLEPPPQIKIQGTCLTALMLTVSYFFGLHCSTHVAPMR